MKKAFSAFLTSSLLAAGVSFASSALSPAFAVPSLQIDILGGTYDNADKSIFTTNNLFTVSGYCSPGNKNDCLSKQHFFSISILDQNGASVSAGNNFGSFVFGGTTYGSGGNALTFGTPPLNDPADGQNNDQDLPTHGVFPTLFAEVGFNFSSGQVRDEINTQDDPGKPVVNTSATPDMYYKSYSVDMSGLKEGYRLHFDLYNEDVKTAKKTGTDLVVDDFAPFSHDAYAKKTPGEPPTKVPEPATLVGLGLVAGGLVVLRRRKVSQTA